MSEAVLAVLLLLMWVAGFIACQIWTIYRVFNPWLNSIQPGDPNFWMRLNDYRAAWDQLNVAPRNTRFRQYVSAATTQEGTP